MKVSASLSSGFNQQQTFVRTNDNAQELQMSVKSSGFGSAVNGAELLLLSLATCFCNDIYREALKRNMVVSGVEVQFTADFGAEGEPGSNFRYTANVKSTAPDSDIEALIRHTDRIAEIHNTLRKGVNITLVN